MKKTRLLAVVMTCIALTACGSKEALNFETETTLGETMAEENGIENLPVMESEDLKQKETEGDRQAGTDESRTEDDMAPETVQKTEGVYEDNFAVEPDEAEAFANKIKEAVAAGDLEALADLTAFPVYVGIAEDIVNTREEFIALGAENILTPGLTASIEGADVSKLSPSMAGFSISKEGKENIIFGVVEGRLAISGINYE